MLRKFLAGCCLAAGFMAAAQAQTYQLTVRSSGPSGWFNLYDGPGLPGITGNGPLEMSWYLSYTDPVVTRQADGTSISAMANIDMLVSIDGHLRHIPLSGMMYASIYPASDPAARFLDLSVEIGYFPFGYQGRFQQSARFAADDLPMDALAPLNKGWSQGQTDFAFFDARYAYRNEEFTMDMGAASSRQSNFSYALVVPEPVTSGMLLAGLGLLAARGRLRQNSVSA
jgi:hypothetical protein